MLKDAGARLGTSSMNRTLPAHGFGNAGDSDRRCGKGVDSDSGSFGSDAAVPGRETRSVVEALR